ncbi:MAG: hypothetical protein QOJ89_3863 [bacterium]|jgi:membrane-bound lytic murein transglycosylase B
MRDSPPNTDPPDVVLDCAVARWERIDVEGTSSSLVRVTIEPAGDAGALAGARLLTTDGGEHRLHEALPAALPARPARLTLGFAVGRTATPLALELRGRSLVLSEVPLIDPGRLAIDRLQIDALRCVSRQLRRTQASLAEARGRAALMTVERDHARRAAVLAEVAAYDATARTGAAVRLPAVKAPAARRASPRTAVAMSALCSTAVALAILGWPTRDGAPDPGAAVAAASAAGQLSPVATRAASAGALARRLRIPVDYLQHYRSAGARYGLDWTRLAAVGAIESTHGQALVPGVTSGANSRGARGPAQFLGGTWERFGLDGDANGSRDPHDPADAIPAMASYLRASGAPQDWAGALRSYNHSDAYVAAVERLAASYRAGAGRQAAGRR